MKMTEFLNPWADQGLTVFDCHAKDDCMQDRSLIVVARDPDHAIEMWLQNYDWIDDPEAWNLADLDHVEVRTLGLPPGAGPVSWDINPVAVFYVLDDVAQTWVRRGE
ncbi:MAG: hypothetical protein JWM36_2263 [Hyphomicrobiales bacterium]|nr:hypothetical protein [Hyphomicrobiales bacterium]